MEGVRTQAVQDVHLLGRQLLERLGLCLGLLDLIQHSVLHLGRDIKRAQREVDRLGHLLLHLRVRRLRVCHALDHGSDRMKGHIESLVRVARDDLPLFQAEQPQDHHD